MVILKIKFSINIITLTNEAIDNIRPTFHAVGYMRSDPVYGIADGRFGESLISSE